MLLPSGCPKSLHRWLCRQGVLGGLWLQGPPQSWLPSPLGSKHFPAASEQALPRRCRGPKGTIPPLWAWHWHSLRWPRGDATECVQA